MNIFDLVAKLTLDSSEYEKQLQGAGEKTKSFASSGFETFKSYAAVGVKSLAAVGGAAAGAGTALFSAVGKVASAGDNIDKISQNLGMSATAYQEWYAIMRHSGTTIDVMQASMKTLASAAETSKDAFNELGLSQEKIASLSQEKLFAETIKALQNVEDDTRRTYLAGQLLGRGATELGALLNTSAEDTEKMRREVHKLGGVLSDDAVKASAKYQDSLQDMQTAAKGLLRGAIAKAMPSITNAFQKLGKYISGPEGKKIQKQIAGIIETLAKGATRAIPRLLSLLDNGAKKLKIFGAVIAGVVLAIKATVNPIGALISGLGLLVGGLSLAALGAESMAEKADKLEHKISGLTDAQWDSIEASKENAEAFDDLKESRAQSFASIDQETERVEDLWKELQKITDENGNVKESDQERADYILGELSEALGEEYKRNGNIIEQYQQMQKEMDKLISKRHATKLLEAGEEVYYSSKESFKENAASIAATEQRVKAAQERLAYLESDEGKKEYRNDFYVGRGVEPQNQPKGTTSDYTLKPEYLEAVEAAKLAIKNAEKDLDDFQKLEEDYLVEIEKYESASAASRKGHYEEVEAIYAKDSASRWKYVKSAKDISAEQLKDLANDLNAQSELFDRHQKGLAEKRKGYSKKMLSDISKDEYDMLLLMAKAVKEAETRGEEVPKAYYDAIKKAAYDLNIPTVGANLVDGIINGMNSRSSAFLKRAKFLVKDALTAMKDVAGIKSPSKVTAGYGMYMGEGLIKGLNSTEQSAERAASNYMDSVLSTMDESANYGGINGRPAYSGGNSIMTEIRNLLQDIRENLGFDVVLSDGTIAGRIDKLLGTRSLQKARGN
jgi:hypothetical protein